MTSPELAGLVLTLGAVADENVLALLDVCSGNLRSVEKALERVGARVELTPDPEVARDAELHARAAAARPGCGAGAR